MRATAGAESRYGQTREGDDAGRFVERENRFRFESATRYIVGTRWSALQLLLQGVNRAALTVVTKICVHAALLGLGFAPLILRRAELGNHRAW
jgi:hypothetical protein